MKDGSMAADALDRFVKAQAEVYDAALAELRRGVKRGHWMWFVFPQIAGLGMSATSRLYAIGSLAEAQAYLVHPLLGPRLRECTEALLSHRGRSAAAMLGGIDATKLRSSMTLFERAAGIDGEVFGGEVFGGEVFGRCLDSFFDGARDEATLRLLEQT